MYNTNLKHLGNTAVIRAMKFFAEEGYSVLLPMGDYQKYDLVVEKDNVFLRVQCKATRKKIVHLASSGHYGGSYRDTPLDHSQLDYLWVSTQSQDYLIPIKALCAKKTMGIGRKYSSYQVTNALTSILR